MFEISDIQTKFDRQEGVFNVNVRLAFPPQRGLPSAHVTIEFHTKELPGTTEDEWKAFLRESLLRRIQER